MTLKQDAISKANRKEIFCLEYIVDFNATRAAKAAGYSKKTAYSQGQRLLKNVEIQKRLAEMLKVLLEKKGLEVEDILAGLKRVGNSNILDYIKDGNAETGLIEWKKPSELTREQGSVVETIKYDKEKGIEYRLLSKLKAFELGGRYHGLFTDNVNVKGAFTHTHDVNMNKLRKAINAIRGKGNKRKS